MADSTLDFDGDDDAPQRARMIRAATVAGWTVDRLWGDADAIDWMRQYPAGFGPVLVITRRTDSVVAIRTTKEA